MLTHKLAKRDIENKSASTVLMCLACQSYYNNIWSCLNNDHQRHKYPEPGSITKFKTYERTKTILFVIYADFECYIEGLDMVGQNPHKSSTTQTKSTTLVGSVTTSNVLTALSTNPNWYATPNNTKEKISPRNS